VRPIAAATDILFRKFLLETILAALMSFYPLAAFAGLLNQNFVFGLSDSGRLLHNPSF
jgi:hypothetical protein